MYYTHTRKIPEGGEYQQKNSGCNSPHASHHLFGQCRAVRKRFGILWGWWYQCNVDEQIIRLSRCIWRDRFEDVNNGVSSGGTHKRSRECANIPANLGRVDFLGEYPFNYMRCRHNKEWKLMWGWWCRASFQKSCSFRTFMNPPTGYPFTANIYLLWKSVSVQIYVQEEYRVKAHEAWKFSPINGLLNVDHNFLSSDILLLNSPLKVCFPSVGKVL